MGHSPRSTHRGAEQIVAPLPRRLCTYPPRGAVSTPCRRTGARGCGAGARLTLTCLSCAPPPLPRSGPPCGGQGGSNVPLCHWIWWERVSYVSVPLLPPLSPEPPRVFLITGVGTGPGGGSACSISHSTPWFSLLEKWSLPPDLPRPWPGSGTSPPRLAPSLPGRGPSPSSAPGPCCSTSLSLLLPAPVTVTQPLFNDFNRACRCMSDPLPRCAPSRLTGDPGPRREGRGAAPPRSQQRREPKGPVSSGPSPLSPPRWGPASHPGNAGSRSGGLKCVLSAGTTC